MPESVMLYIRIDRSMNINRVNFVDVPKKFATPLIFSVHPKRSKNWWILPLSNKTSLRQTPPF